MTPKMIRSLQCLKTTVRNINILLDFVRCNVFLRKKLSLKNNTVVLVEPFSFENKLN